MKTLFNVLDHEEQMRKALGLNSTGLLETAGAIAMAEKMRRQEEERLKFEQLTSGLSHAAEVFRQHEAMEVKRVTDQFNTTMTALTGIDATCKSMADVLQEQEVLRKQKIIDSLLSTVDSLGLRGTTVGSLQTVAEQIELERRGTRRIWEQVTMQDQLSYASTGLSDRITQSWEDRFGAVTVRSMMAISLEEIAGISGAASQLTTAKRLALQAVGIHSSDTSSALEQIRMLNGADSVANLIKQVTHTDHFSARAFSDATSQALLAGRMEQMKASWLAATDPLRSATAFARLQALGDVVDNAAPYAPAVGSWLRNGGLGDWRDPIDFREDDDSESVYIAQGVEVDVAETDTRIFVPSAAIASLFAAEDNWAEIWVPATLDDAAFAALAFDRLRKFERMLRVFIARAMEGHFGAKWMKQQLPNGMLDSWRDKQEKSRCGADYDENPLAYADFTDYIQIIQRKDNWTQVFHPIFGRQEDVRESLQRLHPLRLATMHARSITTTDLLLLLCETKRVTSAIDNWAERDVQVH